MTAVLRLLAMLALLDTPAAAQELRIGTKAAVDSADPHLLFTPNRNVDLHVYEPLLVQDVRMRPTPGLAVSWRATAPDAWELALRSGVTFSDGSPLTAEDVVFSVRRAQTIEGLRTYRAYLNDIASVEAAGPLTVRLRTRAPAAQLPFNLTTIGIVSARAAQGATAEDFNGGRAAVGTGPYRWVRWTPGQEVVLERNPALGQGASNDGQYSNPEFDRLLAEATATLDDTRRLALVQRATRLAMEDQAILPVFHIKAAWGLRRGLDMPPRGDGYTFATTIRPMP